MNKKMINFGKEIRNDIKPHIPPKLPIIVSNLYMELVIRLRPVFGPTKNKLESQNTDKNNKT
jgi:hypothetical protein